MITDLEAKFDEWVRLLRTNKTEAFTINGKVHCINGRPANQLTLFTEQDLLDIFYLKYPEYRSAKVPT